MSNFVSIDKRFGGARKYVAEGCPKDHQIYDNDDGGGGDGKKWCDAEDYSNYPPAVRDAARFRDGLVMDREVYPEFITDFSTIWANMYKKQSEMVFRHLIATRGPEPEKVVLCPAGSHTCTGHHGLCDSARFKFRLMSYHMAFVEGHQSQIYMRDKVLLLLGEDIYSLPKNPQKELSAHPKCKVEYVHSLCVVIYSLVKHKKWFDCKIYVAEELAGLVDACRRCQNGLSLLIKYGTFDDPHMYKVFITLLEGIKVLEELNDSIEAYLEIGRFFSSKALPLYEAYASSLQAKHGVWLPDVDDEKGDDNNHKGEGKDAENQALAQRDKAVAPDETLGKRASGDDGSKSKRKRTKE